MSEIVLAARATRRRWAVSNVILSAGFCLTGVGTVTLGLLLPILSQRWGFRDDKSGFLLFVQFLGSSFGAALTGGDRTRSLMTGYGLLALSAGILAFANLHTLFAAFFLFGVGLGMSMTATSLLFSDRYEDERAAQLESLNFVWSAGAMAAPLLLLPFLHGANLRLLFFSFLGLSLLLLLWVFSREHGEKPRSIALTKMQPQDLPSLGLLLPLIILAVCAVGVETALGGWLTTYSHRAVPQGSGTGAFAVSCFMLGIVLSRLVFSTSLLKMIGRHRVLYVALWCTAVSIALLIASRHIVEIDFAAGLCGLNIGPLYPLLLSFILERFPRGWIFAVVGVGSAVFPWATGVLSAHFESLRYGLILPCGASLLMAVLYAISHRSANSSSLTTPSHL